MPTRPPASLRTLTVVLAVACGATVANLYYAQPLLTLIARTFAVSAGAAALVVTCTQIGYAIALVTLLPLGDLVENRRLITRVTCGTAIALALAAAAPSFGIFAAASVLVGVTSVVAQVLVPLAAHLSPPDERGRFVGRVMSGLLLGILLARTVSSLVAGQLGWRAIFVISAVLMLALAGVLRRMLPERRPEAGHSYGELLTSIVHLAAELPVLRWRALCQASMFAGFTTFWTAIAYELIDVHGLSQTGVAVFALVGAAGAAAAPVAGRLADAGWGRTASGIALVLAVLALLVAAAGGASVLVLAAAGVLLDLAVQGHQVLSQQEIYALRADARSRINTVYMATTFVAGSLASAVAGYLMAESGWAAVCLFGAALPSLGFLLWFSRLRPASGARRSDGASGGRARPGGGEVAVEPVDDGLEPRDAVPGCA